MRCDARTQHTRRQPDQGFTVGKIEAADTELVAIIYGRAAPTVSRLLKPRCKCWQKTWLRIATPE